MQRTPPGEWEQMASAVSLLPLPHCHGHSSPRLAASSCPGCSPPWAPCLSLWCCGFYLPPELELQLKQSWQSNYPSLSKSALGLLSADSSRVMNLLLCLQQPWICSRRRCRQVCFALPSAQAPQLLPPSQRQRHTWREGSWGRARNQLSAEKAKPQQGAEVITWHPESAAVPHGKPGSYQAAFGIFLCP